MGQFIRNALAMGNDAIDMLHKKTVVVLGIGGVGSFTAEALARCGVGRLILIDKDNIDISNINRQLHALHSTIGKSKCEVMAARIKDIYPNCQVIIYQENITSENLALVFQDNPDFIVDAIDTIKSKNDIVYAALKKEIPTISSMAMGNKAHPEKIRISNLWETTYDPIARAMRRYMRERGISEKIKIPVVFSAEQPIIQRDDILDLNPFEKMPPSSNAFVPSVSGLMCASFIINYFYEIHGFYPRKKG